MTNSLLPFSQFSGSEDGETITNQQQSGPLWETGGKQLVGLVDRLPMVGRPLANMAAFAIGASEDIVAATGFGPWLDTRLGTGGAVLNARFLLDETERINDTGDYLAGYIASPEFAVEQLRGRVRICARNFLENQLLRRGSDEDRQLSLKHLRYAVENLPEGHALETVGLHQSELMALRRYIKPTPST